MREIAMTSIDRPGRFALAGAAGAALLPSAAQADPGDGRYFEHTGMMGWGGWLSGPGMMLLVLALIVGAVGLAVRVLWPDRFRPGDKQEDRAHAILRERVAKGEIPKRKIEASRQALDGGAP